MLLFYDVEIIDKSISSSLTSSIKDLPKLYEYYCFLTIVDILSKNVNPKNLIDEGFIKYNEEKLCFNLSSTDSGITFDLGENKKIKLYYNKEYTSSNIIYDGRSYSHQLDPDISIELFIGENMVGSIHFDAKYKLEKTDEYKFEDIDKMHTYKDAILGSIGAYVLYPGSKIDRFIQEEKNQDRPDQFFPSVGAFTLNIDNSSDSTEKNKIYNLIENFMDIENILSSNGIFEQTEKNYDYLNRLID